MAKGNMIGRWAFLIGVILAIILALVGDLSPNWTAVLVVIGLIIGLLNVADGEVHQFLLSGAVLIIAAGLGRDVMSAVTAATSILDALLAIFVPAPISVAVKNVFSIARN